MGAADGTGVVTAPSGAGGGAEADVAEDRQVQPSQISFDLGNVARRFGDDPMEATVTVGGKLAADRQIGFGDPARISVLDADGHVVAEMDVTCVQVTFKRHEPKDGPPWTERVHHLKAER